MVDVTGGAGSEDDGFDEAFPALYRRARSVAHRILGSMPDAEDAAAEAMARALLDWGRVGRLPYREAWVQRVAANVAIDVVRRRRAPAARAETGTGTEGSDDAAVLRLALVAALAELPTRQREAVILRHLVGCPEAEVAAALGVSTNTAKKHLQRGLGRLRRMVDLEGGLDVAFE